MSKSPVTRAEIAEAIARGLFKPVELDEWQNLWMINKRLFVGAGLEEGDEPYRFLVMSGMTLDEWENRWKVTPDYTCFELSMDDLLRHPHIEPRQVYPYIPPDESA